MGPSAPGALSVRPDRPLAGRAARRSRSQTVPYSVPAFVGHTLYLFEALAISRFDVVLAAIPVIVPLVLLVEAIAVLLRNALK